jgi:hypothetical protein
VREHLKRTLLDKESLHIASEDHMVASMKHETAGYKSAQMCTL